MAIEKLKSIPQHEMERLHEEALEINHFVDELMDQDAEISAQMAAEKIIAGREISDLEKSEFGRGWGEKMMREVLARHPAIKKVEAAPKETDEQRKTDAFLSFDKGLLGVQFTFVGFNERGKNDLKNKFQSVVDREMVTYHGKKDVPLSMIRSNEQKFIEAFTSWEARGKSGSPTDYLPQKDYLANEFVKTMAMVLEYKYNLNELPIDQEWSDYLFAVYDQRRDELESAKKSH